MNFILKLIVASILGMLIFNMIDDLKRKNIIEGWFSKKQSCSCLDWFGSAYQSTSCPCARSAR